MILIEKSLGNQSLENSINGWEECVKMDLKERGSDDGRGVGRCCSKL
jgi:hypothetical protein